MYELKTSFAGLLLIFIILAEPHGLNATYDFINCKPYGSTCNADNECCLLTCHKSKHSDSGICQLVIDSFENENETVAYSSDEYTSTTMPNILCREDGFALCKTNETCCSGLCSIPENLTLGVCSSIPYSEESNSESLENDKSYNTIMEDIHNNCRPLGSNLCESHSECCTEYCEKQDVGWDFGVCNPPKSDIPENGLDGFYERGLCTTYEGIKMTVTGEPFNPNLMTAAHRTLPFGSMIRVVVGEGKRQVVVRINDRKVSKNREILQLPIAASNVLGIKRGSEELCNLMILTEQNCTPSMAESCFYNQECCSKNCYQEFVTEPGFCIPHSAQLNNSKAQ